MSLQEPKVIRLQDYVSAPYQVEEVSLTLDLDPEKTQVRAALKIRRRNGVQNNHEHPLVLDGRDLELKSIALDGKPLDPSHYSVDAGGLTVFRVPDHFTLETEVEIDPSANTALEGLYMSGGMFCTQCEAEGFRRITYFPDRPDVMAVYTVRLLADLERYPVLLSNGNASAAGALHGGRHFAEWHDPHPKPSYLFAAVAGDLGCLRDCFTTRSGREVELRIYTEHGNERLCTYAMQALKRSMKWDEERFGREYDLDIFMIVAVSDFNGGAMENKGLNIFNAALVYASPETATDHDYERIERVIAHEYFHNWTGNRITCRDWFQLCLKEGLTVYRDQEFSADMRERNVARMDDVTRLRAVQFPEDAGGLAHPVRPDHYIKIDNFYTATVYEKGAELIRMIETLIGPDAFRRGMDLYFDTCDNTAATVEDFVTCFEKASGRDLSPFMRWYTQAGTPRLTARGTYDAGAKTYTLRLAQETPPTPGQHEKRPVPIPVAIGLIGADGRSLPVVLGEDNDPNQPTSRVVTLDEKEGTFIFKNVESRPVPSLLRAFSAPVILDTDLSVADRIHLIAHDEDAFNRRETAHGLAVAEIAAQAQGRTPGASRDALIEAVGACLDDTGLEPAFLARLITPPREDDVAQAMDVIDPGAIHTAREAFRHTMASALRERLEMALTQTPQGPFEPSAAQAGARALANAALQLLASLREADITARVLSQARDGRNMTDRLAALSILADLDEPQAQAILDAFYEEWRTSPLVVDKWFQIQAGARRPGALDKIRALSRHKAFTLRNPNRVRALVGALAAGNPTVFHDPSGDGYAFFAEQILALDKLNPLLAARLFGVVKTWRKLEPHRRGLIKGSFERIGATKPISDNLYEVVTRTLAD